MLIKIVANKTNLSEEKVQEVLDCAINNMTWDNIGAYNKEIKRGQIYEDAGGYLLRCIGRLFGAKYYSLKYYQNAVRKMIKEANN